MISSTSHTSSVNDAEIWNSLKLAIYASAGFQRWQLQLSSTERTDLPLTLVSNFISGKL